MEDGTKEDQILLPGQLEFQWGPSDPTAPKTAVENSGSVDNAQASTAAKMKKQQAGKRKTKAKDKREKGNKLKKKSQSGKKQVKKKASVKSPAAKKKNVKKKPAKSSAKESRSLPKQPATRQRHQNRLPQRLKRSQHPLVGKTYTNRLTPSV